MKMEGTNKKLSKIVIDLIEFKIEIHSPNIKEALTLLFDSPSRRFFCSLIALVVIEMKIRNKNFINIRAYTDILSLLDQKLAGKYASDVKEPELMYGKIRKAWPRELSNLENASRFKILYRGKFLKLNSEWGNYDYLNDILDTWPSLIRRHEDQTWFYSFDVNQASITLNDVLIIFGQHKDAEAWERFLESIKPSIQVVEVEEQSEAGLSSIKDNLLAFLSDIKNKLELRLKQKSPIYYQNKIDPKKLFIPIQVTIEKFKKHIVENLFEYSESKEDLRRAYAFKKVEEKTYNAIPWEEVTNSNEPIIVLADPGMGKSTLLIMEALSVVQKEELKLKKNHIIEEDLKFPIYLKLNEISKSDEEISKTILNVVKKNYPETSKPILNILKNSLMAGKCLLLFDGLDEVPRNLYYKLLRRLNRFLLNSNCRIIGTSRIVGYSGGFLGNVKEVEIVPFNEAQIREFVNTYFKNIEKFIEDKSISSKGLLQELSDKPQIRGMAQNPLLITIICRLYQEKDIKLPTRRCLLYKKAINYMLSSLSRKSIKQTEARVQSKISLLEEMAYFFSKKRKEIFSLKELLKFTQKFLNKEKSFTKFYDADSIITELSEDDGILIKLNREGDRYIFFHLTFQEYLAASYLKEVYEDNQSRAFKIVSKFLYDFRWHETITLLVGLLSDPITFIRYIKEQEDDIFYSLLILAGKCIAECNEIHEELIVEVFDKLYKIWVLYPNESDFRSTLVSITRTNPLLLKILLKYFKNEKVMIRDSIPHLIAEIDNPDAIPTMIEALSDESEHVRTSAILALKKISGPDSIPAIIEKFRDENRRVGEWAAISLGEIDSKKAIPLLIEIIKDKDMKYRASTTTCQGELGSSDIFLPAFYKTFSGETEDVRSLAAFALGEIGHSGAIPALIEAIPALIEMLDDASWRGIYFAVNALEKIGSPDAIHSLIRALGHEKEEVRYFAAWALITKRNDDAIPGLIVALRDESHRVVINAVYALEINGGPDAIRALKKALTDENEHTRADAAYALGCIRSPEALLELIEALKDESESVRSDAISALGKIGNVGAFSAMKQALSDECEMVRCSAAEALWKIDSPKVLPALIEALNDESEKVRSKAAYALGKTGRAGTTAILGQAHKNTYMNSINYTTKSTFKETKNSDVLISALIEALCDVSKEVRKEAIKALGEIGNPYSIPPLIQAFRDENEDVRKEVVQALQTIGSPDSLPTLVEACKDESMNVRRSAINTFRKLDEENIPLLIEVIKFENIEVRISAASALCSFGRREGILALLNILKKKQLPLGLKDKAISGLKKIKNIEILKNLIESPDIDIYDRDIFSLARGLAIHFYKEDVSFMAVYPEEVEKFKKLR